MGASDSYFQLIVYYHKEITNKTAKFNAPCFLMELVGPRVSICSAVTKNKEVLMDPLGSSSWLLFQPKYKSYLLEVARLFKALKQQLEEFALLYEKKSDLPQPEYPFF